MLIAMSIAAILCVFIGTQPQYLYALLPWEVEYWPYETTHVLSQFQLLFFAALAFVWLNKLGIYPREMPAVNLDADWLYRKLLPDTTRSVYGFLKQTGHRIEDTFDSTLKDAAKSMISTRLGRFNLAASWPTGSMAFWLAVILGLFLLADAMN